MKVVVINNPAARSSGALTILKDCLEKISLLKCNRIFYVIVSLEELKKYESDRVKILVINRLNFKQRIFWDNYKLKKYINDKNIELDYFISLQNTGVNLKKTIPQIIYYHQLLSLVDFRWDFFKKEERTFWMYQKIYPLFIKQYLNRAKKVIVQSNWVKECFSKKFNYSLSKIVVMKPEITLPNIQKIEKTSKNKFRIFYPATPLIYKNHKIIIEALELLKKENKKVLEKVECIFTFSKKDSKEIDNLIKKYELENVIFLVGNISYENILSYYRNSDILIFPSYLETLGLPLLEAKHFNLNILVSDLPYARETLENYQNLKFIDCFDKNILKNEIKEALDKYLTCEMK